MYTNNPKERKGIEETTGKYAGSYAIGDTEARNNEQKYSQRTYAQNHNYASFSGSPESGINANLVSDLFKDKLAEQKELVGQLIYLIDQRQRLFKRNVNELEKAISRAYSLEPGQTPLRYAAPSPESWKNRVTLEKTITDIESKKSAEYVRCWQDIAQVKKDLWPVISEYYRTRKKLEMLYGKERQDDIFNPYLKKPEYQKETKVYVLSRRRP